MAMPEILVYGPDPVIMAITILGVFFIGFITGIWVGRKHVYVEFPRVRRHGRRNKH